MSWLKTRNGKNGAEEGKQGFFQKSPHVEICNLEIREMVALAKVSFKKRKVLRTNDTNSLIDIKKQERGWNLSMRRLLYRQHGQFWKQSKTK